jgi:hypothetical protein
MPLQTSIPANGGNVVVTVTNTAGAACAWIAISQSPSLSVSGPSSGNGSGIATFVVQPNGSTTARTLKATVAGQPIQIDQAGAAVACAFAISPSSAHVPKAGATLTVSVQVTQGIACSWTASSFQPWMVVTSGSSGTGNGTVTVYVEPNTGPARLSSVTIAGKPFNVNQDDGQTCGFSVTPLTISVPAGQTFTKVTVNNTQGINCPWSAVPSAPWVYFLGSQTLTGAGTDTFDVFTALNTGAARTATIDIAGYVINVSQAATALPSNAATVISFQSDPGDYVGGGQSQTLTFIGPQQFNAQFNAAQGSFSFATLVAVEPSFSLNMLAPPGQPLAPGYYSGAQGSGLGVFFDHRSCGRATGRFAIGQVVVDANGALQRFHAAFEQHCSGGSPALRGTICSTRRDRPVLLPRRFCRRCHHRQHSSPIPVTRVTCLAPAHLEVSHSRTRRFIRRAIRTSWRLVFTRLATPEAATSSGLLRPVVSRFN